MPAKKPLSSATNQALLWPTVEREKTLLIGPQL